MSELFPEHVQESIFRLWDVIAAFSEDLASADAMGFIKLVRPERIEYVKSLLDHGVLEKTADEEYRLGNRGREAYTMIGEDVSKPTEESQVRKYLP